METRQQASLAELSQSALAGTDLSFLMRQAIGGWRYCGTQATTGCTNLRRALGAAERVTDVYRRADDQRYRGATIEIWPMPSEYGQTFVTVFETRGK
jgi:hypothetical protein